MKKTRKKAGKKPRAERLVTAGIALSSLLVCLSTASLLIPGSWESAAGALHHLENTAELCVHRLAGRIAGAAHTGRMASAVPLSASPGAVKTTASQSPPSGAEGAVSAEGGESGGDSLQAASQGRLGTLTDLEKHEPPPPDLTYSVILDTAAGPMLYYNQGDIRWGDYLYGGADPMKSYGCGPTAISMIINSFTPSSVTPVDMAQWAAENGGYAPQSGSYHSLIPNGLSAFGLAVESVASPSPEAVRKELAQGHLLVALMGRGALTENGHFIIITKQLDGDTVSIADPNNFSNCFLSWDLSQLIDELKNSHDSGGPLWSVGPR